MKIFSAVLLAFIAVVLIISLIFRDATSPPPIKVVIILTAFCLYWLTFDRLNVWYWSHGFSKRPDANSEIVWQFSETQIIMQSILANSDVSWKSFYKIVEMKDGFLFYWQKKLFVWIPFTAFEADECITTVRQFIAEHGY